MHKEILDIPAYLRQYFVEESQLHYYEEYKKRFRPFRKIEDRFICLKNLSSSTPIINTVAFDTSSVGGGFFLRLNGVGIVVDPGIGFVTLMHQFGIFIDDIDAVIVTHAHIDHNCDVAAISSLLYDYNRNREKDNKLYSEILGCNLAEAHSIEWYMDSTTLKATKNILDEQHVHKLEDYVDHPGSIDTVKNGSVILSAFHTRHIKGNRDTFGIKLDFTVSDKYVSWGYTSDTAYFEGLENFFRGCNVLLFNISDIYVKDVRQVTFKQTHLGFAGSIKLLNSVKPGLALASEFCCTRGDYRHEIVRALRETVTSAETTILPAEVGCKLSADFETIECTICKRDIPTRDVKIIRPREEFGRIQYVCPHCLL